MYVLKFLTDFTAKVISNSVGTYCVYNADTTEVVDDYQG